MPNKSVNQGSKLAGMMFTISTLDACLIPQMMKNQYIYKLITGEDAIKAEGIIHKVTCYVDDVQHVLGHKSNITLETYVNKLHILYIAYYGHNKLKINVAFCETLS